MAWSEYWSALSARGRAAVIAGAALIALTAAALILWLLHDPYVPLASGLSTEQLNELAQELDRAKLSYRVDDAADAVAVPRSQLGKARAATAGGPFEVPPSVGLELFRETDFSTTDFAQRINYQRALQGELTRTIQTIAGVHSARVHVILPEGGLFKRSAARATAAVSVSLQPGKELTRSQVRGIQRLVAASVPEIKVDDVVVLDESGTSLTRAASDAEGDMSSAQLDLKRQADQYLEGKLLKLLQDLVPQGAASLSVDTVLEDRQLRVTSDEPTPARGLVKERQSQRGPITGATPADVSVVDESTTDWEKEYVVGHRTEQTVAAPGSIKRLSVAVALQGVPASVTREAVEQLIVNAVGLDRSRGDSAAVLMLPALGSGSASHPQSSSAGAPPSSARTDGGGTGIGFAAEGGVDGRADADPRAAGGSSDTMSTTRSHLLFGLLVAVAVALLVIALVSRWARARPEARHPGADANIDTDALAAKVRQWLKEGARDGRT